MKFVLDSTERTNEPPSPTQRREKSGKSSWIRQSVQTSLQRREKSGKFLLDSTEHTNEPTQRREKSGKFVLDSTERTEPSVANSETGEISGKFVLRRASANSETGEIAGKFVSVHYCTNTSVANSETGEIGGMLAAAKGWSLGVVAPPAPPFAASMTSPPPLT